MNTMPTMLVFAIKQQRSCNFHAILNERAVVPEFIIKNALRNLGLTKKDFFHILFDVSK